MAATETFDKHVYLVYGIIVKQIKYQRLKRELDNKAFNSYADEITIPHGIKDGTASLDPVLW